MGARGPVDGLAPASYRVGAAFCMRAHICFSSTSFSLSRRWIGKTGSRRPISAPEAPWALKFEVHIGVDCAVWRRSKCRSRPRIPCRRRRRRGRRGPRRGRRFQVQVPARPRVSAEITVCRVGQPSALLRDARSYTTPWATYGSTASSATAASMPCGSGPRRRRRSSK